MSQENNNMGAPSSDDTSALFVTARKKQLEEQEAQRKAAEEERRRLDAEAEVRRLEEAVRQRKLDAEEEAKRVEQETKRIAEEARLKREQAEKNPESVIGTAPAQTKPAKPARAATPKPAGGTAVATKAPMDQKTIIIIAAAVGAVVLAVVLFMVLGGGGSAQYDGSLGGDMTFEYPKAWTATYDSGTDSITLKDGKTGTVNIQDVSADIVGLTADYGSEVDAVSEYLNLHFDLLAGDNPVSDFSPLAAGSDGDVVGTGAFTMEKNGTVVGAQIYCRTYNGRAALFILLDEGNKNLSKLEGQLDTLAGTLAFTDEFDPESVQPVSGSGGAASFPEALPGYIRFYEPESGVTFEYPNTMSKDDIAGDGAFLADANRACLFIVNLTDEYAGWASEGMSAAQCNREFMQISIDILGNKGLTVSLSNIIDLTDTNDLTVCDFTASVGQNGIVWNGFSDICFAETATDEILGYFILYTQDQESQNIVNQIIRTMDIVK